MPRLGSPPSRPWQGKSTSTRLHSHKGDYLGEVSPGLLDVIHQYGASWQIVHDAEIGVWTAVNRPTPTALHFICAHSLASLAVKLAATGDRSAQ
jgi:hypothetical protein